MNVFRKIWCRTYQFVLKIASPLLGWREPIVFEGQDALLQLCQTLKNKNCKVLVVCDQGLIKVGLVEKLCNALKSKDVFHVVFDKTVPNPTLQCVKDAFDLYTQNNCDTIVALGGGSSIDCAKGVGILAVHPNKSLEKFKGILKVGKKLPTLVAIPTTAGTGSECTAVTVLTNQDTHQKYAISDLHLIPQYAVLDASFTKDLPRHLVATTGMDALTHAVEAYVGKSNTKKTATWAVEAIKLIFNSILPSYQTNDHIARANMQKASYLAGLAFTRAYVGYVHAVAHSLGGWYNVPHGLANAVILPHVLLSYGNSVTKKLAYLATVCNVKQDGSEQERAKAFIDAIKQMNKQMGIADKLDCINAKDVDHLASLADKEANPLYPVPKLMDKAQLKEIFFAISK